MRLRSRGVLFEAPQVSSRHRAKWARTRSHTFTFGSRAA
jgi:hypothetical protein